MAMNAAYLHMYSVLLQATVSVNASQSVCTAYISTQHPPSQAEAGARSVDSDQCSTTCICCVFWIESSEQLRKQPPWEGWVREEERRLHNHTPYTHTGLSQPASLYPNQDLLHSTSRHKSDCRTGVSGLGPIDCHCL
jgi:hypothetical protein